MRVKLVQIAHARGGDKGDKADLGLFAYDVAGYEVIRREVSAERVAAHFAGIARGRVECFPLDNLLALKFVLHEALDGGAARSLRSDNLGKSLAAGLLRMEIEVPDTLPLRHEELL
ncbi:MAG TPA: hypothetical protein VM406_03170 [Noviherbaspirillum sp.]|nr:hypothetical protein [Noviherbaspirillum sp.]